MYPSIFAICAAAKPVTDLIGSDPVRFWPFGLAPKGEARPYAVHQLAYGTPENTLSCAPVTDNFGIQVDAYAKDASASRELAGAIRDALETQAHVVAYNGENWEQSTGLYRVTFTVEFWTDRT